LKNFNKESLTKSLDDQISMLSELIKDENAEVEVWELKFREDPINP
jgi:hypothetical protein